MSWEQLQAIVQDNREELTRVQQEPLVCCPYDGEPLDTVGGLQHCQFCGRQFD
jgi:hypothetical protein